MKISIVSPCFNESENLSNYFNSIKEISLAFPEHIFEIVIVDDFSTDSSREMILHESEKNPNIVPVLSPRNYGVYKTTYAGLRFATGDLIVPMFPVDLQDPPEVLIQMIAIKLSSSFTGVFGRKIGREESFPLKQIRTLFYSILSLISSNNINKNVGEFGIVDRWVIDACLLRNDYYPFIRGIISNITSDILFFEYTWQKRSHGKSNHNYVTLYDHGLNAFISSGAHFFRPLVFFGFAVSFASILFGMLNIFLYFFDSALFQLRGIASIIVLLSIFFGLIFIFLGFIGEYIMAIHAQVRGIDDTSHLKGIKK